MPIALSYE